MWIRVGGGGSVNVDILTFYNIIIKSPNVDKGVGGENAYPQNVDKKTCFFTPPYDALCVPSGTVNWLQIAPNGSK